MINGSLVLREPLVLTVLCDIIYCLAIYTKVKDASSLLRLKFENIPLFDYYL